MFMASVDEILDELGCNEPLDVYLDKSKKGDYFFEQMRNAPFKGSKIRCTICGKIIDFDTSHWVEEKVSAGVEEKTVSSGFPTGVTVKQINRRYRIYEHHLCDSCYSQYLADKKKRRIRNILMYLLGAVAFAVIVILAANGTIDEGWLFAAVIPVILVLNNLLTR